MATWSFQKVQYGYWGGMPLRDRNGRFKVINVKAPTLEAAKLLVMKRKDYYKQLRNGDYTSWFSVGELYKV